MPSRDAIGLATCKRMISSNSNITQVRISQGAAEEAQRAVAHILRDGGAECAKILKLKRTKTVDIHIVSACMLNKCKGIIQESLTSAPRKGKGQRGVPLAGAERLFREGLGDARITEEAKKALVGAAEAYLRNLGHNAGLMAKAARRQTIQDADIVAARSINA